MMRFSLIGAAGYIAPRHMKAMSELGANLVAAIDTNDSVGVLDSHFPDALFFTRFEDYDGFLHAERQNGRGMDYVSIVSPNYLHLTHMAHSLRAGADAICEKPLVLELDDLDRLGALEAETGKRIHTILQLRLHPAIIALRDRVAASPASQKADVDLTYITSRGNWYLQSWKGETEKSGGIATNIGVHFFDMLHFVYGKLQHSELHMATQTKAAGFLEYERARVRWFLSIDVDDVPAAERAKGRRTWRALVADGENIEFSDGFTDLHTTIYREIIAGRGYGIESNRAAIETVSQIRHAKPILRSNTAHPLIRSQGRSHVHRQ